MKYNFLVEEWPEWPNIMPVRHREVTFKGRCPSGPQKSVHYTKVFAITCPLHRSFSREFGCRFIRSQEKCPLYGGVIYIGRPL